MAHKNGRVNKTLSILYGIKGIAKLCETYTLLRCFPLKKEHFRLLPIRRINIFRLLSTCRA